MLFCTQFEPNLSILDEVMAIFPKSKMAAAVVLFLQKMMILATLSSTGCYSAPAYRI